jgi:putative membrane protein
MSHSSTFRKFAVVGLAMFGTLACDGMGGKADSTLQAAVDSTPMVKGDSAPAITDPNIFAFLDMANVSDSAGGAMAMSKGTSADIKSYGRMMVTEHHAMRKQGADLARTLNVTPQPMPNDSLKIVSDSAHAALAAMPKGTTWDRNYIDHAVREHQTVLHRARSLRGLTQNAELQGLLDKATPTAQAHLDRAMEIQRKLGGGIVARADSAAKGHDMSKMATPAKTPTKTP